MEFFLAAALLALIAKAKKSNAAELPPPPAPPPAPVPPVQAGGGGLGFGLPPIPPELAGVAAGLVVSYAAGEFGGALTGDKGGGLYDVVLNPKAFKDGISVGKLTGNLNPGIGTAINVGRALGAEFDKAAGGTGKGLTGTIAQVSLGAGFGLSTIIGAMAAVATAQIGLIVYGVAAAIEDQVRLKYGQGGARRDWDATWVKVHGAIYSALRGVGLSDLEALAISYPYTDGYMIQKNWLAYLSWMKRGRGLFAGLTGVDDETHARFGRERGYFVVRLTDGRGGIAEGPERWTEKDKEWWGKFGAIPPPANQITAFDDGNPLGPTLLPRPFWRGVVQANLDAWWEVMVSEPVGIGKNAQTHLQYWIDHGRVNGQALPRGGLRGPGISEDGVPGTVDYDFEEEKAKREASGNK